MKGGDSMNKREVDKLTNRVRDSLMQQLEIPSEEKDKLYLKLKTMSRKEILDAFFKWEGIIGYTNAVASICGVE